MPTVELILHLCSVFSDFSVVFKIISKNVICNVATAIKSFFALNYVYNEAFNNIFKALVNGDFTTAQELLNKYSFKDSYGRYRTLANVNMDAFDNINWNALPDNIKIPLLEIYNWQAGLDDQSLMLAELLNVATDLPSISTTSTS